MDEQDPHAFNRKLIEMLMYPSDPEDAARQRWTIRFLLGTTPSLTEVVHEGRRRGLLDGLHRVLAARGIALSEAEEERLAVCDDVEELLRWVGQASRALTVEEALR